MNQSAASPEVLTAKQAAGYLQVPQRTLDKWRYQGTGPRFSRVGRWVRYRKTDVDAWLTAQSKAA